MWHIGEGDHYNSLSFTQKPFFFEEQLLDSSAMLQQTVGRGEGAGEEGGRGEGEGAGEEGKGGGGRGRGGEDHYC